MYKIGAIGAGHMGMVILDAFTARGADDILAYDIDEKIKSELKSRGFAVAECEKDVYENCELLLLAVRPQNCVELFGKLINTANKPIIISIMAGISSNYIREQLGSQTPVVMVMPTMGMKVNHGFAAIAHTDNVPDEVIMFLINVFNAYGESLVVNESEMAEIEGISGCMPGYVYYMVDAFARGAQSKGMNYELAAKMAVRGFLGAATQVLNGGHPGELLKQVCTPGGLTAKGIESFNENKLDKILHEGMAASIRRRYEIGR